MKQTLFNYVMYWPSYGQMKKCDAFYSVTENKISKMLISECEIVAIICSHKHCINELLLHVHFNHTLVQCSKHDQNWFRLQYGKQNNGTMARIQFLQACSALCWTIGIRGHLKMIFPKALKSGQKWTLTRINSNITLFLLGVAPLFQCASKTITCRQIGNIYEISSQTPF